MEIKISKDKDTVFFSVDNDTKLLMNFDNLVKLSESVISEKQNSGFDYKIICEDGSLDLYKSTMDEVLKSIMEDEELLKLLKEKEIRNSDVSIEMSQSEDVEFNSL